MIGPDSDKVRYTVHVFPLLVILSGIPIEELLSQKKLHSILAGIIILMVIQTVRITVNMRVFLHDLARHQECRNEIGLFLNNYIDKSNLIVSSDIGEIGYRAIDFIFLDITGLTSVDVLMHYRNRKNIDDIFDRRKSRFIADTFRRTGDENVSYQIL